MLRRLLLTLTCIFYSIFYRQAAAREPHELGRHSLCGHPGRQCRCQHHDMRITSQTTEGLACGLRPESYAYFEESLGGLAGGWSRSGLRDSRMDSLPDGDGSRLQAAAGELRVLRGVVSRCRPARACGRLLQVWMPLTSCTSK